MIGNNKATKVARSNFIYRRENIEFEVLSSFYF